MLVIGSVNRAGGQLAVEAIPYVTQQRAAGVPTQLLGDFDHATAARRSGGSS